MRLKRLPPTLRERKRYILFEVISEGKIDFEQFKKRYVESALTFFGEKGLSEINLKFLGDVLKEDLNKFVIRVSYKKVPEAIFLLGLIDRINDSRINIKIYKVSGTIKSLVEKFKDRKKLKNEI